jgi:hypothetical protein
LHRLATAHDRRAARACHPRALRRIDVNTVPDTNKATAMAAAGQTEEDIARQDGAGRARPRLARTFPAQIEALTRHRNNGEAAITVQNVSVGDGGKAVVGNVTLHARVIIADKSPA